jgi:hypothetical protein
VASGVPSVDVQADRTRVKIISTEKSKLIFLVLIASPFD